MVAVPAEACVLIVEGCNSSGLPLESSVAPAPLFHPLWGNILRNLILFGKLITGMCFLSPGHRCSLIVTLAFLSTGPCWVLACPTASMYFKLLSVLWFPFYLYLPAILPSFFCSHEKKLEKTASQRYLQSLSSFFPVTSLSIRSLMGSLPPSQGWDLISQVISMTQEQICFQASLLKFCLAQWSWMFSISKVTL